MKPLAEQVRRLAPRLMEIEKASTLAEAEHAAKKAEKHRRKIQRWHRRLERLNLWNR